MGAASDGSAEMPHVMHSLDATDLVVLIFVELFGLRSALCCPSVVMMGFRSCPFLLFFPPLPLVALFAALATCLALFMAAFLISFPLMVMSWLQSGDDGISKGENWLSGSDRSFCGVGVACCSRYR